MTSLTLGFIPLTDCAPLAVAEALGLFHEEGLTVSLSREASWATLRDKLAVGALQGAHMLAPMALASEGVIAPLALNRNGAAVTLSAALAAAFRAEGPAALKTRPLTLAVVFPLSLHNYLLRHWLSEAGMDPDRDVRLVVVPPPRLVEQLRSGAIDGFCGGAPWNAVAEAEGVGETVLQAADVWPAAPDKVLGAARAWAEADPSALKALLRALLRAGAWADDPANAGALGDLLARPGYVGAAAQLVWRPADRIAFRRGARPALEDAAWLLAQMARWGQTGSGEVFRPDLHDAALASLPADRAP